MVSDQMKFEIIKPERDEIDIQRVQFTYDRLSDTLMVHFFGEPRAAYSLDVSDFEYIRVDLETKKIVGLQVEAFLTQAILTDPRYLLWALRAGISWEELAQAQQDRPPGELQEAAVASALENLELAIA